MTGETAKLLRLRYLIEERQALEGKSDKTMGKVLGLNPRTFRNKVIGKKQFFTYPELIRLGSVLHFTEEEKLRIL